MTPQQAIEHFGSQKKVADALGIRQPSIAGWLANGAIPVPRQYQLQVVTQGALKIEPTERAE